METSQTYNAVFDIGKTNVKLSLLCGESSGLTASAQIENAVLQNAEYPCADTDRIWAWLKSQLKLWSQEYVIKGIGITTHGAAVACVVDEELIMPVLDYEYAAIDSIREEYNTLRPAFDETLSPSLPFGLNLGAQIYWLQKRFPEKFKRTQYLLLYPQYWGLRLSGTAVSEVTSLGCHTDLWNPNANTYSSLVDSQNWRELFPPLCASGKSIGHILPTLAEELGLPRDCEIYNGIHDSNASLVPHLLKQQKPFAVVSTGTWTIIAGVGSPTACLDESKDMLANVNAFGEPTACIRFMGGREWKELAGKEDASETDFLSLCRRGVFALPSFSTQGGPFRHRTGAIVGAEKAALSEAEKTALATLYLALMTDHCLTLLQQNSTVIIEGAFARNQWLMKILACLREEQTIMFSEDVTGTTAGTALLSNQENADCAASELFTALKTPAIQAAIVGYKQKWQALLMD